VDQKTSRHVPPRGAPNLNRKKLFKNYLLFLIFFGNPQFGFREQSYGFFQKTRFCKEPLRNPQFAYMQLFSKLAKMWSKNPFTYPAIEEPPT